MHDQFGEQLTALSLRIGLLKEACGDRAELREQVDALEAVAQQLDRDVDHLVWELRPTALDDLGLRAALANYMQDWSSARAHLGRAAHLGTARRSPGVGNRNRRCTASRRKRSPTSPSTRKAKNVEIILERRADHVVLIVEDDGVGFEPGGAPGPADQGFGLLGMQERAALVGATLQIESAAGTGTTILVRMAAGAPAGGAAGHA